MVYYMHETIRNPKAARKAAPARHRAAEKKLYLVGCSKENRLFSKFGISLARDVSARRRRSHETKASARPSTKTESWPETSLDTNFAKRPSFAGISHRFMDHKTRRRSNRETVRRGLSPQPSLAFSNRSGLELPETREASQRTRRKSHTALETLQMAAYKKTRIELAPIWSFLTRAASSWFPISGVHGRRGDRLLICLWQEIGRRCRQSLPSVPLLKESALPCIFASIPIRISRRRKLNDFCTISCVILKVRLFFCGIRAWFIGLVWLRDVLNVIKESTLISSLGMRLNLTPLNLYGRSLKGLLQTLFQRIWIILKKSFFRRCVGFVTPNVSYGHVYGHQICHGDRISITYA